MTENGFRVEHDSMGEVRVPAAAKWRAQTQRAVENFPVSGERLESAHIAALARIKASAARVNASLGVLDADVAHAIASAADEVAEGRWDDHFPVDVFQTGSGTSSNMNVNEVLATLATERLGRDVHPNDHVNASQSSNDVFPSSIHVAATSAVVGDLVPALEHLAGALERKATEFAEVVKSGRTHLMDATPVTLGQEFGGYAAQVRYGVERLATHPAPRRRAPAGRHRRRHRHQHPARFRGRGHRRPRRRDRPAAHRGPQPLRGPGRAGRARRALRPTAHDRGRALQDQHGRPLDGLRPAHRPRARSRCPTSSPAARSCPARSTPSSRRRSRWSARRSIGNDAAVAFGGAAGNFELNVMLPMLARNVLGSIRLLANISRLFADRCVDGITADVERCLVFAESSPSVVTPLNRFLGYEEAASIAKQSLNERRTIKDVVLERGHVEAGKLTAAELDSALDVLSMTHP